MCYDVNSLVQLQAIEYQRAAVAKINGIAKCAIIFFEDFGQTLVVIRVSSHK